MVYNGSTPQAVPQQDFLVSEDPWFRPVDIKIGPDGALYIADFYNRIIGHYEVPLDHPGRDRTSGRIWRITYKGRTDEKMDWSKATVDQLLEGLGSPVISQRMMASNRLVDYKADESVSALKELLTDRASSIKQKVHALWVLKRLDQLDFEELKNAAESTEEELEVHAYRVLSEYEMLQNPDRELAKKGLTSNSPHVQRAAAEVLVRHPDESQITSLVEAVQKVSDQDSHLKYTLMIALREHLKQDEILNAVVGKNWDSGSTAILMDAMTDVPSSVASEFIFTNLKKHDYPHDRMVQYFAHVGRYIPKEQINEGINLIKTKFDKDPAAQYTLYQTIESGLNQRGGVIDRNQMKNWAISFAKDFLTDLEKQPTPVADGPSAHADETYEFYEEIARQQTFAAQIAGEYRLKDYQDGLSQLLKSDWAKNRPRAQAAKALIEINLGEQIDAVTSILSSNEEEIPFRVELAKTIGASNNPQVLSKMNDVLKDAPSALQVAIASVFVNSSRGRNYLLTAATNEVIPPRILLDRSVNEQLLANLNAAEKSQYNQLTSGMESVLEEREKLIESRLARFVPKPDVEKGKAVFVNVCSVCHQIEGQGGVVGPQLDGIGNWGRRALTEKVLDPNRTISQAFKTYTLTLKNGEVKSGLFRRTEGELEVYASNDGKEFSVRKDEIQDKKVSQYTLMPDNFGESISEEDFDALIGFLLTQK